MPHLVPLDLAERWSQSSSILLPAILPGQAWTLHFCGKKLGTSVLCHIIGELRFESSECAACSRCDLRGPNSMLVASCLSVQGAAGAFPAETASAIPASSVTHLQASSLLACNRTVFGFEPRGSAAHILQCWPMCLRMDQPLPEDALHYPSASHPAASDKCFSIDECVDYMNLLTRPAPSQIRHQPLQPPCHA